MRTQTKVILILSASFISLILLFGLYIYYAVSNFSHNDFYKVLEIRAYTWAKTQISSHQEQPSLDELRAEFFEKLPEEKDVAYKVLPESTFENEAKMNNLPITFFQEVLDKGLARHANNSLFYLGIKYTDKSGEYIVITSATNYFKIHHNKYLSQTLILASFVAILLSFALSFYFSKRFFRPLKAITNKVNEISSKSLNLRLETEEKEDELSELTSTFNSMLDRIETAFESQNNFISNASHEFRTPLTAIIGEAEVALSKLRSQNEYVETIQIILEEAEKLDDKTKALLFLAQTAFKGKEVVQESIRIDEILWDVIDTIRDLNKQSRIHLNMDLLPDSPVKLKVQGNEQLLHLAFSNIIANGCKYSDNAVVDVSLGATEEQVIIIIRDRGIGIPEQEIKFIYDPFFRASNTRDYEGYGIGMPLSQNIIRIHKGEIRVYSKEFEGTTVEIRLPFYSSQS